MHETTVGEEKPPPYDAVKGGVGQNENLPQPTPSGFVRQPPVYPHNTTVIAPTPIYATNVVNFSTYPIHMVCPLCYAEIMTSTYHVSGLAVWLVAVFICCLGGFLGCCLLPFCVDGLKDVDHVCPNCNNVVGVCKRL